MAKQKLRDGHLTSERFTMITQKARCRALCYGIGRMQSLWGNPRKLLFFHHFHSFILLTVLKNANDIKTLCASDSHVNNVACINSSLGVLHHGTVNGGYLYGIRSTLGKA